MICLTVTIVFMSAKNRQYDHCRDLRRIAVGKTHHEWILMTLARHCSIFAEFIVVHRE